MESGNLLEGDHKRSVLGRAFDILDCFGAETPEQTIAGVCGQTGLPPATVHRMLAHLVEWGAVERASRGRYRLGRRLWRLGWGVPEVRRLRDVARPFLVDLYSATGAPVALWSRDCDHAILSDLISGHKASGAWQPERRVPLAQGAGGLAMLAYLPLDDVAGEPGRQRDDGGDFVLRQRLGDVRRLGYAVSRSNVRADGMLVAAPIFDEDGQVRAAVSIRLSPEPMNPAALARVVLEAALLTSRGLGHRGPGRRGGLHPVRRYA
ncbi:IclR family transcriptional regulator [Terrabacter aerolatus]|uniref:IclR family transcriptional regulator n=1 Tax=Terrabacter aerolatus TaxID=422442 RepID=A0A512D511_9MICO|nr:helix-turn-helix domain-containing protein [Terrabacter aerolatus]GEO31539.1 IclR family transcriptional regulator [Terrabacter aerolatus]